MKKGKRKGKGDRISNHLSASSHLSKPTSTSDSTSSSTSLSTLNLDLNILGSSLESDLDTLESDTESLCPKCKIIIPNGNSKCMVQCDQCAEWYHIKCANLTKAKARELPFFHCMACRSTIKKKDSSISLPFEEKTELLPRSASGLDWEAILSIRYKRRLFSNFDLQTISGHQLTLDWIRETLFLRPFLVPEPSGLDLVFPNNLTPHRIAEIIGPSHLVDVIHVPTQSDTTWTLQEWVQYFTSPKKSEIYNLISLEFSRTPLHSQVLRPRIVRDLDVTDKVWPLERKLKGEFPFVQHYVLMSVAGSYTDFHIDFGGTSVFYHILEGEKTFYLIEPTPEHLKLYHNFSVDKSELSSTFFGDVVNECYQVTLYAGQTFFIPSGWIHAVYTHKDSLVFGGNFLWLGAMQMQFNMVAFEIQSEIPYKFRYPYFDELHWYAAAYYFDQSKRCPDLFRLHELHQFLLLIEYLQTTPILPPKNFSWSPKSRIPLQLMEFETLTLKCIVFWERFFPPLTSPSYSSSLSSFTAFRQDLSQPYFKWKSHLLYPSTIPVIKSLMMEVTKSAKPVKKKRKMMSG